jgi:hypothetical protein
MFGQRQNPTDSANTTTMSLVAYLVATRPLFTILRSRLIAECRVVTAPGLLHLGVETRPTVEAAPSVTQERSTTRTRKVRSATYCPVLVISSPSALSRRLWAYQIYVSPKARQSSKYTLPVCSHRSNTLSIGSEIFTVHIEYALLCKLYPIAHSVKDTKATDSVRNAGESSMPAPTVQVELEG